MSFSPLEMERHVFKVMGIILSNPSERWPIIAEKAELEKDQLFDILDYIDREGYLANINFSRGRKNRILIPFLDHAVITEKGMTFMKKMQVESEETSIIKKAKSSSLPSVFISYNWDNDDIASAVETALSGKAIVHRDKKDIPNWGSLSDFMKSIRKQDFAVLVISEPYLKSDACLFEVMQLMKDEDWNEKAMYVVLSDAHIYKPIGRAKYISYWTEQCAELEKTIASLPASSTSELNMDLRKAAAIRDNIGEFLTKVADTSNPDSEKVVQAIISRVTSDDKVLVASPQEDSKRETHRLSKEAASILITAANGDLGIIISSTTLSSYSISINDKMFVDLPCAQGREVALWKGAIASLLNLGLIEDKNYKGELFGLTSAGYDAADQYAAQMNGEKLSCPQCHYSGPTIENGVCPICGFSSHTTEPEDNNDDPIHIVGVITEEVSTPRNDGTRGSALYTVPLRLSKKPSNRWGDLFVSAWNNPPRFSTMHRPGIASVFDDKIILNGTTIEEVRDYHIETLKLCVDIATKEEIKELEAKQAREEQEEQKKKQHINNVESVVGQLKF